MTKLTITIKDEQKKEKTTFKIIGANITDAKNKIVFLFDSLQKSEKHTHVIIHK